MKYLVMAEPGERVVPPDMAHTLLDAAADWIRDRLEDEHVECVFFFPTGGGFAVANAESHEELQKLLVSYPLYPFMKWDLKMLIDWQRGFEINKEFYSKMRELAIPAS